MRPVCCSATLRSAPSPSLRGQSHSPKYCDPDAYGDWEEMAFPRANVTADLSDEDLYPFAIAQFRLYARSPPLLHPDTRQLRTAGSALLQLVHHTALQWSRQQYLCQSGPDDHQGTPIVWSVGPYLAARRRSIVSLRCTLTAARPGSPPASHVRRSHYCTPRAHSHCANRRPHHHLSVGQ